MITVLSSPKPGSGTSTTAALLAVTASDDAPTTLVDLCGDQPTLFNCPTTDGRIDISDRLSVHNVADNTLGEQLAIVHDIDPDRHVVIDAGHATHPIIAELPTGTVHRWVIRPCYLALRRALACGTRPDEVIVLDELGRALRTDDVTAVLAAPVVATIEVHPNIARLIDAGLLPHQPPRHIVRALTGLLRTKESTQP